MDGAPARDRHGGRWDKRKRRSGSDAGATSTEDTGIELVALGRRVDEMQAELDALRSPIISSELNGVFDMQQPGGRAARECALGRRLL